ncbi:MAG: primosomal protein N' [Ignavibacteria bacterium]
MFAEIALDLPLHSLFTYSIPGHLTNEAVEGKRVVVSFGKRTVTGIIVSLSHSTHLKKVIPIKFISDKNPVINSELLKFCKWISDYYIAPPGEVLFSCVPRKSNLSSTIKYELAERARETFDNAGFRSRMYEEIFNIFMNSDDKALTLKQVEKRSGLSKLKRYIENLIDKRIINEITGYELPTKERIQKIVSPGKEIEDAASILKEHNLRSPKYTEAIKLVRESGSTEFQGISEMTGITLSQILRLSELGIVTIIDKRVMREHEGEYQELQKDIVLNEHQQNALDKISGSIEIGNFKSYLLHGVTGSGKTEVYIKVASKCIATGKTVIILVPEISLTPQLIHRFKVVFRNTVGTIHSKLSEGERLDTFDRILNGDIKIVIGARSALFAPLKNIGLIVVDEEHDSSYKQETSPRYNGRDAAVYRASLNNAVVLLGSATPSIESYYNASTGKYTLVNLPERVSESFMPEIKIVDLSDKESFDEEEKRDFLETLEKTRVRFLSKDLIFEIGRRLMLKENVIILQNRRGYHSYLECRTCGNVEMCERCNIALAYHKALGLMKCHYCGFSRVYTGICSKCNSMAITPKGAGTEKVEEELQKIFPRAVIVRMDSDTLTSRRKYEKILKDFYDGKIDILTGTQIISKGLDFPNVTLVGVINADIGLLNPDFRATEKTFQILTQVSGRSGRSNKKGEVLIQTNHANYFVFGSVKSHDYQGFYEREIKLRKDLTYPPFSRIALIESKCENLSQAENSAKEIYNFITSADKKKILNVFPPVQPLFSKLKDKHRFHVMIKSPKDKDPAGNYLASVLRKARDHSQTKMSRSVMITFDVDAVNLM